MLPLAVVLGALVFGAVGWFRQRYLAPTVNDAEFGTLTRHDKQWEGVVQFRRWPSVHLLLWGDEGGVNAKARERYHQLEKHYDVLAQQIAHRFHQELLERSHGELDTDTAFIDTVLEEAGPRPLKLLEYVTLARIELLQDGLTDLHFRTEWDDDAPCRIRLDGQFQIRD